MAWGQGRFGWGTFGSEVPTFGVTDIEVLSNVQASLLEPPNGGASFISGIWTSAQALASLNDRQRKFLSETGITVMVAYQAGQAGIRRYALPNNVVDVRRVAWANEATPSAYNELPRADAWEMDHGVAGWPSASDVSPSVYMEDHLPTLTIEVSPAPTDSGEIELTASTDGVTLTGPISSPLPPPGGITTAFSIERLAGSAISAPGTAAPNEQPWTAPGNATLNTPGTYASVTLNFPAPSVSPSVDQVVGIQNQNQTNTSFAFPTLMPSLANEWALLALNNGESSSTTLSPPFTNFGTLNLQFLFLGNSVAPLTVSGTMLAGTSYAAILALLYTNGAPVGVQENSSASTSAKFLNNTTAGNTIIVTFPSIGWVNNPSALTVTDDQGNNYTVVSVVTNPTFSTIDRFVVLAIALNIKGGVKPTVTVNLPAGGQSNSPGIQIDEVSGVIGVAGHPVSQVLQASNFGLNVQPSSSTITGLQAEIFGHQSVLPADAVLTANLLLPGAVKSPKSIPIQLGLADGQVNAGTPTELWGEALTPALLNDPTMAVQIVASAAEQVTFNVYAVKLKVFASSTTPSPVSPPASFDFLSVPDDFSPYLAWGVRADLLHAEGEGQDPIRAQHCESRFAEGIELARILVSGGA